MIVVTIEQGLDGDLRWRCWSYDKCVRMLVNECSGSAIKNIRRGIAEQCVMKVHACVKDVELRS